MKKTALAFALASGVLVSANSQASCTATNHIVERVLSYGTYGYVYFRPQSSLTNSFYYYMRTTSDQILSLAGDAQTNRTVVNASGDAATCPTSGTARYMGNSNYINLLN